MARMKPAGRRSGLAAMVLAIAACVFLIALNSVTRIRQFTPDSMSYVDVAHNFADGRGLSQSALGFGRASFTPDDPIPAPFTAHAPGYSMLIAAASLGGFSFENAALVLAAVFFGLSVAAAFLLARECYGEPVAWLGAAVLLNYYPARHAAAVAWSETAAIFMSLVALWLLARFYRRPPAASTAFLVGLFSGLAFAIRYPMCELAVVTGAAVLLRKSDRRLRDAAACGAGVLCAAGPVIVRNVLLTHTLAGAAANPHPTPLIQNLTSTLWAMSAIYQPYYLQTPPARLELSVLLIGLAVVAAVLAWQRRLSAVLREALLDRRGAIWIATWSIAYLAFINIVRSLTWFDDLTHRLTVPAGVTLAIVLTAFVASTVHDNRAILMSAAGLLIAAALAREIWFFAAHSPESRDVPWTPRLTWVANHTTARDLIIGDYTMDLPFYFRPRNAITFEHYPYTNRPTYEGLHAYVARHCGEYDHVYLIVRDWYQTNVTEWVDAFGWMICDLMIGGDNPKYPDYHLLARLPDSAVFAVTTPVCAAR
jgi:hypothetical protein